MFDYIHNLVLAATTNLAATYGIPRAMTDIFLLVPFVAFLLAFLRHFVGLKTIGLFFPILLAVIFALNGFVYGFSLTMAVALLTLLGRILARPFRLLYLPRSAFVITFVSIGFYWTVILLSIFLPQRPVEQVPLLSFVALLLFTEDFLRVLGERGVRTGTILMGETVLLAMVGGLFLRWGWARETIYRYPEVLLLVPVFSLLLNQWNGLRLAEWYRFRMVRRRLVSKH